MHEDIKTALDESRKDEARYVYKYPENDLDETKKLDDELKTLKAKQEEKVETVKEKKRKKEVEEDDDEEPRSGIKTI